MSGLETAPGADEILKFLETLSNISELKPNTVSLHVPDARSISSSDGSQRSSNGSNASSETSRTTLVSESFSLQREVEVLRKELKVAQLTITALQEREKKLKCRLAEQAQKMFERGHRFENISLGEKRPTALIRNYEHLYSQARFDTLDALDALLPLQHSDELKTKILFSVIVLAFRSVQNTLSDIKLNIRSLLQVRDFSMEDATLRELDDGVATYLRKNADTFNLTKNASDVCSQIYATLYDYPCLKDCPPLIVYVRDCVRIAWCLTNQNPPFNIEYEYRTFSRDYHTRFHCSDPKSDAIKSYMWPVLLEGENGPVASKGIVLT